MFYQNQSLLPGVVLLRTEDTVACVPQTGYDISMLIQTAVIIRRCINIHIGMILLQTLHALCYGQQPSA